MTAKLTIITWKENDAWVSECLNNHVSSYGKTQKEAEQNVLEALELFYEGETDIDIPSVDEATVSVKELGHA